MVASFCRALRGVMPVVLAAGVLLGLSGCHVVDYNNADLIPPVPPESEAPRAKSMVALESHQIAPPDILLIEMNKMVVRSPYRAKRHDMLMIQVRGTMPDYPIYNYYMVDWDGMVDLGVPYGKVKVVGMTTDEAEKAIDRKLSGTLVQSSTSVSLAQAAGTQQVTGHYLVAPDGTVNLRRYGEVHVAGLTVEEAQVAVEKRLAQYFDSPEVAVSVAGFNSKVFYLITEGAGLGDNVYRIPLTGNETVMDAFGKMGGRSQLSSTDIWIARPAPEEAGCRIILPVDYDAIMRDGLTATNYQLFPGDRLYVAENKAVAVGNFISKMVGPMEQGLSKASLTVSAIRNFQTLGRNYNKTRR